MFLDARLAARHRFDDGWDPGFIRALLPVADVLSNCNYEM